MPKIIHGLVYLVLSVAAACGMFYASFAVTFTLAYDERFTDNPLLEAATLVPFYLVLFVLPGVLPFAFGMKFKLYLLPALLCVLAYLAFLHEFSDFQPDTSIFEQITTTAQSGGWVTLAFCLFIALRALMPSLLRKKNWPRRKS